VTTPRIHFLSGLPRTGSTLLGSLLNQNPSICVSPTSPLYSLLVNTNEHFNLLALQYTFDEKRISSKVYRSLTEAFYQDREQPIAFDKHRGWPKHVEAIREFIDPEPRIVCTVRPIAEIITSYLVLAARDPDNFIDRDLKAADAPLTDEARAHLLWTQYLKVPYDAMLVGLKTHRRNLLLVDYDALVYQPQATLLEVYDFCGLPAFRHDFQHVENTCAEAKDVGWGLKDLHTIRPRVERRSADPLSVLPAGAIDYFAQFDLGGK
jgi:sulfotransferase